MTGHRTTISLSRPARNKLRALKRGGQSYEELLDAMAEQYDPETDE